MSITICNLSNVYGNQPYLEGLKFSEKATWLDLLDISGTDCYCDDEAVATIRKKIADAGITDARGIHFIDNGNYHYMSKIWTDMVQEPFTLVVFDHHPDMQEPRFGDILSCGGWVKKTLDENKFIDNVVLIGVADHLVEEIGAEIASHPAGARNDMQQKVTFIRESEIVTLEGRSPDRVHSTLHIPHSAPLYISIDKDVLAPAYAATNWDQGSLSLEQMKAFIEELSKDRRIIGVDICGERARDFNGDKHHSVQEADALNNKLNRDLAEFFDSINES